MIEDVNSERPGVVLAEMLRTAELADTPSEPLRAHAPRPRASLRAHRRDPKTLEEVGTELGVTRERVRQLESRALRELQAAAPDLRLYLRAE